jgi:hypothetical protein
MKIIKTEMTRILKDKTRSIAAGRETITAVMTELHAQVVNALGRAALGSWDSYYLAELVRTLEEHMETYGARAKTALSGLLDDMWAAGTGMVDSALALGGMYTGFRISTSSIEALKNYSNGYLEKLFGDTWHSMKAEINLGILGAQTPQQVAQAIGIAMDEGIFKHSLLRGETITQTEMGRIFSTATQARMDEAAEYVPGLEKQWIHAGHPREPRLTHVMADGQHVPVKEPFLIGGVQMMYPRDPRAPIAEVIHCGCDHIPYHPRWEQTKKEAEYGSDRTKAA